MKKMHTKGVGALMFLMAACTTPDAEGLRVSLDRETAGADGYGMRQYVLAYLKTGSARSENAAELQQAHMANIERMAAAGQLVLAGPLLDGGEVRGLYIFDTPSVDSARAWTATDPAVQAGVFDMELHPWYGSAALLAVNELHEQLADQSITE